MAKRMTVVSTALALVGVVPRVPTLPRSQAAFKLRNEGQQWVESGCGAVAVGWACLFPPLSSGGALVAQP
jgi:hypothetical protein